jgi:2-octaprenyl-6-methoxyphenol hydroxylase
MSAHQALQHIAIVGAGPVGLSAALLLARALPSSQISLFDSRPADAELSRDRRTLALALGTTQLLEQVASFAGRATQGIAHMVVSDVTPLPAWLAQVTGSGAPAGRLQLDAAEAGLPSLGTVLAQGDLTAALLTAWQSAVAAEPQRLSTQMGQAIKGYRLLPEGGVELDGDVVHVASLLVVAEGMAAHALAQSAEAAGAAAFLGKPLVADYAQTAWVGTVELAASLASTAVQCFTPVGPLTLLPADAVHGPTMAAVVACVPSAGDPLQGLDDVQRVAALNQWLGSAAPQVLRVGYLKPYPLALAARKSLVNWGAGGSDVGGRGVGRVIHIGAAAQTTYPLLASAIDMGLRDAYELAAKLHSAPADAKGVDAALRSWELGRTPERWGLIALTDLAARTSSVSLPGLGDVAGGLRAAGLAAVNAAGPLKRALLQQLVFGARTAA